MPCGDRVRRGRPGPKPKFDWDTDPLLGKVSDRDLARLRGCSRQNVTMARKARGIPQFAEPPGPSLDWAIARALRNRYEARSLDEIYFAVLNDFGGVAEITFRRRLARMVETGIVDVNWERHYCLARPMHPYELEPPREEDEEPDDDEKAA